MRRCEDVVIGRVNARRWGACLLARNETKGWGKGGVHWSCSDRRKGFKNQLLADSGIVPQL